jgi:hypothetical protein
VEISGSRSKDVPGKKHEISCEKQTKNEKEVELKWWSTTEQAQGFEFNHSILPQMHAKKCFIF